MKIFYDVDTQNDFMNKNGALYVPDAEIIKPNLKLLTDYARENFLPVVGSVDKHFGTLEYKHRETELQRWGGPFPDHCMDGTLGLWKINETRLTFPSVRDEEEYHNWWGRGYSHPHALDNKVYKKYLEKAIRNIQDGLYFEKQSYDVFTNPSFPVFLNMAKVREAVVYGVATDYCVKAAVLGMQNRGIQCYVVEDVIKGVVPETTKAALEELTKAGAKFVTTKDILEGN